MAIMFSVIMGAMQLSALTPVVKIMTEGKIAGKLAFEVIDHKPIVDGDDPNVRKIKSASEISGRIEFKNVDFIYPTRKDLKVLKNFSAVIEAGKTTALVGPSGSGKSTVIQLIERYYAAAAGEILFDG